MKRIAYGSRKSHVSGLTSQVLLRGLRIGVIGTGTMGQALLKGLLAHGVSRHRLRAAEANSVTRRLVRRRFGVHVSDDPLMAIRSADVVVLAVKPQQFPALIAAIEPTVTRRTLVISIAAGVTLRWLAARLPAAPIIRVMPNLPATVGDGFTAVTRGARTTARHRAIAAALFGAVGEVVELPERHFDAVTAVSGSGPAYLFFLLQAWHEAARAVGLPPAVAVRAIRRTLRGSARLLEASGGLTPDALIRRVASKGGTTEAALRVLERHRVRAHFTAALRAAARRSKELAWS